MTDANDTRPLKGLRVLELARVLAGPWVGQTLADLGADVVKVESPEGDDTRTWGPPFVEAADGGDLSAAYYHAANRGKRSVVADFRTPEGQNFVRRLANHADVVVENFKVGGLVKYGLDYAGLKAVNPRVVYASITGFGQTGPYAPRAGYDFLIQGMAGAMSITGAPDGEPMKTGYATADIITGLYATIGILAALRRRDATGEGSHLDLALMDSQIAVLANVAMNHLVTGAVPQRLGNTHPSIVPYQTFQAADGPFLVAVGNDGQYRKFCEIIGATGLATHPDYVHNEGRVRHRAALIPQLQEVLSRWTRADLLPRLDAAGVPAGPLNTIADVFADPQVVARGMRVELPDPDARAGYIPSIRTPIVIDGVPQVALTPSPRHGEHQAEVEADPHWGGVSPKGA